MSKPKKIKTILLKLLVFIFIWFGYAVLMTYTLDTFSKPSDGMGTLVLILIINPAGIGSHLIWLALRSMRDPLPLFSNIMGGFVVSLFVLLCIGMYVKAGDPMMFAMVGGFALSFLIPISIIELIFRRLDKIAAA